MTDTAAFVITSAPRVDAKPAETAMIAKARPPRHWRIVLGLVIAAAIGLVSATTLWTSVRPACACVLPPIRIDSLRPAAGPENHPALRIN